MNVKATLLWQLEDLSNRCLEIRNDLQVATPLISIRQDLIWAKMELEEIQVAFDKLYPNVEPEDL